MADTNTDTDTELFHELIIKAFKMLNTLFGEWHSLSVSNLIYLLINLPDGSRITLLNLLSRLYSKPNAPVRAAVLLGRAPPPPDNHYADTLDTLVWTLLDLPVEERVEAVDLLDRLPAKPCVKAVNLLIDLWAGQFIDDICKAIHLLVNLPAERRVEVINQWRSHQDSRSLASEINQMHDQQVESA